MAIDIDILYVGIDPGKSGGAIGIIAQKEDRVRHFASARLNTKSLAYLKEFVPFDPLKTSIRVAVEHVGPRNIDRPKTAFTLGQSFGEAMGYLAALGIEPTLYRPSAWQSLVLQRESRVEFPLPKARAANAVKRIFGPEAFVKIPVYAHDAVLIAYKLMKDTEKQK